MLAGFDPVLPRLLPGSPGLLSTGRAVCHSPDEIRPQSGDGVFERAAGISGVPSIPWPALPTSGGDWPRGGKTAALRLRS